MVRRYLPTLLSAALIAASIAPAHAWDSRKRNPTHPTHSYLTEYAINQVQTAYPEAQAFRAQLLEGANTELHELSVKGAAYGIDLDAARVRHHGTNAGCDDPKGWWDDCLAAYQSGHKQKAYFLLGVLLHMVEDMGVPAHANGVYHQGSLTEFDNFEFLALSNWRPSYSAIDRQDPAYDAPWRYYAFSQNWTHTDAPDYHDRNAFSKTWTVARSAERRLLQNRQGRTAKTAFWTLQCAQKLFHAARTTQTTAPRAHGKGSAPTTSNQPT